MRPHSCFYVNIYRYDRVEIFTLKYTCMRFFVLVFGTDKTYIRQIIRLLSVFDFVLEFAKFLNIWRWLSCCGFSFPVNWINAKWDSTSTESTRNDEIFVNVCAFCVDSVDVESLSALTQLMVSLTLRWLHVRKMNQAKTGIHNKLWHL